MKKITLLLIACFVAMAANAIVYVKPAAAGGDDTKDGSSWANAKATVAGALTLNATANPDRTIWVQGGEYTEAGWSNALQGNNGIKIYGGFKGDETSLDQRAKGTKAWEFTNASKFTFTAGMAIALGNNATEDKPVIIDGFTIQNCTLSDGQIVNLRGYSTLQNCIFLNNDLTSKAVISSYGSNGPAKLLNSYIKNNKSTNNNILDMSSSGANSPIFIEGCLFENNHSTAHQVAQLKGASPIVFANNIMFNNLAGGNIINATAGTTTVANCLIFNNTAAHAITGGAATEALIVNNTIVNNVGGVTLSKANEKLYNNIVRGNINKGAAPIGITGAHAATAKNNAIDVALDEAIIASGSLMYGTTASGFATPSAFQGRDEAKASELAITNWALTNEPHNMMNAGDNAFFIAAYGEKDVYGNARVQQTTIDLGAVESAFTPLALPTLTVVSDGNGEVSTDKGGQYLMGAAINITSTPAYRYKMKEWKVGADVVSTDKDFTFLMPAVSATLTAFFEESPQFALTITAGENGTASTDKSGTYYVDETIELTATPATDYVFAGWYDGNDKFVSKDATFTFTMPEAITTLKATFKYKLNRYLVSEIESFEWDRQPVKGETIINLEKIGKSFEEYYKANSWPTPLSEGDEIWLMSGTYKIFEGLDIEALGVKFYGGFGGTETSIDQREKEDLDLNGIIEPWEFSYQTELTGQFTAQRVGTVLKMGEGVIFDGVKISGGFQGAVDHAAGVRIGPNKEGAARAILRNSIVSGNTVANGTASAYNCGAVVEHGALAEYCLIENNTIESSCTGATYGAGITAPRPKSEIRNCVIRNNRNLGISGGLNHGGGVKVGNGSITNCVVYNNTATRGGGIYADNSTEGLISYCTVVNNHVATFKPQGDIAEVAGGGVYFRGQTGGSMYNSVIWGNTTDGNADLTNIYIQQDAWKDAKVVLGGNAYNGGATAIVSPNYTSGYGNDKSIIDLPNTGVFVQPTAKAGYNAESTWTGIDWRPKTESLNKASKQIEDAEYDFFGNARSEATPTYGAFEFGSEPQSIDKPSALTGVKVYSANGAIRVSYESPVTVTVYNALGMKVAVQIAATDHTINLQSGYYIVFVQDANNAATSVKTVVR